MSRWIEYENLQFHAQDLEDEFKLLLITSEEAN
jgi:hypothetical protein